jgi:hypothetical protein
MGKIHEPLHLNKWSLVQQNSETELQVLIQSLLCLTKVLNIAMVPIFEIILLQKLNHPVHNYVILCSVTFF